MVSCSSATDQIKKQEREKDALIVVLLMILVDNKKCGIMSDFFFKYVCISLLLLFPVCNNLHVYSSLLYKGRGMENSLLFRYGFCIVFNP